MTTPVLGLHHVTAIAGDAKRNFDFYTGSLGLRFVKKTVNFDDPHTYHLYYGDYHAAPGTILTFFPWPGVTPGRRGVGQATEIGYSVPAGSLDYWRARLEAAGATVSAPARKFGEDYLTVLDPDGLSLELTVSSRPDDRPGFAGGDVAEAHAIKGFHNVTLSLASVRATAEVLTDLLGYRLAEQHENRYRFVTDTVECAHAVDLLELPNAARGNGAGGTVHHVAFRVADDVTEMALRARIAAKGFQVTPQIDRNYFHSLYFREPGGVLFEIATDNPGFTVDESLETLGTALKLPPQHEALRQDLERTLAKL